MKRFAAYAIASTVSSLAGGLHIEPMDDNEWTLAQVGSNDFSDKWDKSASDYSDYWEESSDKTGHWNVHDNTDLRDQCDVEINDYWKPEGWSFDDVKK